MDTSGEPRTGEYLAHVTLEFIKKNEDAEKYGAKVVAVVTDNAANMNLLRETIEKKTSLITYGCGAHQFNLLRDIPNRLGSEKVTKLAFCLRALESQDYGN